MMYPSLEIRFIVSEGLVKYPYTKTIHLDLHTMIHHSLGLVITPNKVRGVKTLHDIHYKKVVGIVYGDSHICSI